MDQYLKEINDFKKINIEKNTFYLLYIEDDPRGEIIYNLIERVFHGLTGDFPIVFEIYVARDLHTVISYIKEMENKWNNNHIPRSYKGFDAVICDLELPRRTQKKDKDVKNGYKAIELLSKEDWPAPVVVLSSWTDKQKGLEPRIKLYDHELSRKGQLLFYDFLGKKNILGGKENELAYAKLRRQFIPLFFFEQLAQDMEKPTYFIGTKMLRVMRQLVQIAMFDLPPDGQPVKLPQILLLGPPGAGKSKLAYFYLEILKFFDKLTTEDDSCGGLTRPENVEHINCGFLTGEDLGGRMSLFGARNLILKNVVSSLSDKVGAFEKASKYHKYHKYHQAEETLRFASLSSGDNPPCYRKGGVVFLDEFANLHPNLQAAVLTTLEEGKIRRVVSDEEVVVGCHVICATNVDPNRTVKETSDLGKENPGTLEIRDDLIDRIPYIIVLPGIKDYNLQEIEKLVLLFATERLKSVNTVRSVQVSISPSALKLLEAAINQGLVNSMRHLQSIANVGPGESIITEANLRWVLKKGIILERPITGTEPEEPKTTKQMVTFLGLPSWLETEDLPTWTQKAVKHLYDSYKNGVWFKVTQTSGLANDVDEVRGRAYFLANCIKGNEYYKVIFSQQENPNSFNSGICEERKNFGFSGKGTSTQLKKHEKRVLLSPNREFQGNKKNMR